MGNCGTCSDVTFISSGTLQSPNYQFTAKNLIVIIKLATNIAM